MLSGGSDAAIIPIGKKCDLKKQIVFSIVNCSIHYNVFCLSSYFGMVLQSCKQRDMLKHFC
jgi:hypothetical protein